MTGSGSANAGSVCGEKQTGAESASGCECATAYDAVKRCNSALVFFYRKKVKEKVKGKKVVRV